MWLILCRLAVNVAVTVPVAATVQVLAEPVHTPVHPPKPKPVAGEAVRITCGLPLNVAVQVPGQVIPAGELVTVPLPAPAVVTVRLDTPFTSPWHPAHASSDMHTSAVEKSLTTIDESFCELKLG
jgi:hypothetical protein